MTQPLPLRDQLKALEQLQEIDLKIDDLKKQKAALPAALKSLDEQMTRAKAATDKKQADIAELEKMQRQVRAAGELNGDRLTRANAKLENVANSHEYQAASKEIDQLKKMTAEMDEQLKKSDQEIAAANSELASLNEQLSKTEGERQSQAESLKSEETKLDSGIESLGSDRKQYVAQIEKRVLASYERIRGARGGIGVVPALGGRCKGCNMVLPPQIYNLVQRGAELQFCPSCSRLLFA